MSPKIVDREKKKLRIIDSAYQLFLEKGFPNTRMEEISASAGIGKGTIYEYFDSKEKLLAEIIETMADLSREDLEERLKVIDSPEERLRMFIRQSFTYFEEIAGIIYLSIELISSIKGRDGNLSDWSFFRDYYENMYSLLEDILQEGIDMGAFKQVDTRHVSIVIGSALEGFQFPYLFNKNLIDTDKVGGIIEDMVFAHLAK